MSALGILLAPGLRGALLASSSTSLSSSDSFPPLLAASFFVALVDPYPPGVILAFFGTILTMLS